MLQEKQDKQKIVVLGFQKTKNKNKTTETELTAGVLKKKIFKKDTKGETERFFIRRNKTECKFSSQNLQNLDSVLFCLLKKHSVFVFSSLFQNANSQLCFRLLLL